MNERLVKLLTRRCADSAAQTAQDIYEHAIERNVDYPAIVDHFRKLLPEQELGAVNNWQDAQRVITRACFILESRKVLLNLQREKATLEA